MFIMIHCPGAVHFRSKAVALHIISILGFRPSCLQSPHPSFLSGSRLLSVLFASSIYLRIMIRNSIPSERDAHQLYSLTAISGPYSGVAFHLIPSAAPDKSRNRSEARELRAHPHTRLWLCALVFVVSLVLGISIGYSERTPEFNPTAAYSPINTSRIVSISIMGLAAAHISRYYRSLFSLILSPWMLQQGL